MNSGNLYTPFCVTTVFMLGAALGLASNELHLVHKFTVLALATVAFHFAHTYKKKAQ